MLITYSYSGPYSIPLSNGGIRAFPGWCYLHLDIGTASMISIGTASKDIYPCCCFQHDLSASWELPTLEI
jgi:hypothetical protein